MGVWLAQNAATIIICIVLLIIVVSIIISLIKKRRNGIYSCGGDCSRCTAGCSSRREPLNEPQVKKINKN